jgi:hypothetical protein
MPGKSSQCRAVSFVHLSCVAVFEVDSELACAVLPDVAPLKRGVEPAWRILVLKPQSRDEFRRALAQRRLPAPVVRVPQKREELATPVQDGPSHSLRGSDMRPGEVDEEIRLYCPRCCTWISIPSRRLKDHAERHPGHDSDTGLLVAYVADRGEVVYRRDAYAEELVRRDRRAKRRGAPTPPSSLKRSDTWTPVRTAPKEVRSRQRQVPPAVRKHPGG